MHGATKWLMAFASELKNKGHDSSILCTEFNVDRPFWLTADIVTTGKIFSVKNNRLLRLIYNYISVFFLATKIPKNADVLIFHSEIAVPALFIAKIKYPKAKFIYYCYQPPREAYDLWPVVKRDYSWATRLLLSCTLPLYRLFDRYLVNKADYILVWSDEYEEYASNIYGEKQYIQIPAGVDFKLFNEHDRTIVNRLHNKYSNSDFILLINATLTRKKNIDLFILLIKQLSDNNFNVTGVVIGEGPLLSKLIELSEKTGTNECIDFVGYVSQQELPCYYFIADILYYLEPNGAWSMSIIEAGAANIPVIVAPGGSMPSLVINNQTGFILPELDLKNALYQYTEKLLSDSELRSNMGTKNYQHSLQFSLDSAVDKFLSSIK